MSRANANAYPIPGLHTDPEFNGLSVREAFAMAAMQGLLANAGVHADATKGQAYAKAVALVACMHADALIAELAKVQS